MHISEGVLSAPVLLTGAALTAAGVAVGLKKMDTEKVPHEHKIRIRFAEGAVDEIMQQAVREEESAATVCRRVTRDYDYAFGLVIEKTGQQEFVVPKKAIRDAEGFFNEIIMNSYGRGSSGTSSTSGA